MIINDLTPKDVLVPPGFSTGGIDRDFALYPQGYLVCAKPFNIPLMTDAEIEANIAKEAAEGGSLLGKIAHDTPILDQDGYGYCWAHSSAMAVNCVRLMNNQPYVALSAFAVAAIIKNYRDQGGWGGQSLEWIEENGIPSQTYWPQGEVKRSLDTPEMRADAALRKTTEWMDLDPRDMKRQLATAVLSGIPVASDYNWWGHSVCCVRILSWNPFRTWIKNSWKGWGDNGIGELQGSRAVPDGAICPRVQMA
mgnify:CR=1 FL=1